LQIKLNWLKEFKQKPIARFSGLQRVSSGPFQRVVNERAH